MEDRLLAFHGMSEMVSLPLTRVLQHLQRTASLREGGKQSDGQLLEAMIERRDEAAFEVLVRRHGPMVLGVCRRVLGNMHDAEDAFQATFIVLARKAVAVRPRDVVGNWLYGVAYRTSLEARAVNMRRRSRERQVQHMPEPAVTQGEPWGELKLLLDEALSRLPDKYRVPVVLCELEGRGRKEVARQLGVPEGTLSSRLATARKMLASRLARRGLAVSGAALAVLLSQQAASACVPLPLAVSTVKAATLVAAGEAAAAGLISAQAVALAEGVTKIMFLSKLKCGALLLLALCLCVVGAGSLDRSPADEGSARADGQVREGAAAQGVKKEGDAKRNAKSDEKTKDAKGAKDGKGETVTLTGKVSKEETKRKRDDGSELLVTAYFLTEAKGNKVLLPAPRVSEGNKSLDKFKLADFVGKQVTITGRALVVRAAEGADAAKRVTRVLQIAEIQEKK